MTTILNVVLECTELDCRDAHILILVLWWWLSWDKILILLLFRYLHSRYNWTLDLRGYLYLFNWGFLVFIPQFIYNLIFLYYTVFNEREVLHYWGWMTIWSWDRKYYTEIDLITFRVDILKKLAAFLLKFEETNTQLWGYYKDTMLLMFY